MAPRGQQDLADLQARQIALLRNALAVLAPGGLLVYSTCSLEPEENQAVVAAAAPRERVVEPAQHGFRAATPGMDSGRL